VTKYVGVITEPRENSRYWPAPYVPKQNFLFNIHGRVTPVTEPGQTTVVELRTRRSSDDSLLSLTSRFVTDLRRTIREPTSLDDPLFRWL
jgi:hypothetical protein